MEINNVPNIRETTIPLKILQEFGRVQRDSTRTMEFSTKATHEIASIKVLLLVGGKGTRLASVSNGVSKGLITIDPDGTVSGVEHMSRILSEIGLTDVTLLAKHHAEQYKEFAKEKNYSILHQGKKCLGTGKALEEAIAKLGLSSQYLVIAADTYLSARDVARLVDAHKTDTVTWGVSLLNPDLDMGDYHGLVIDSQNQVIGDVKQFWWQDRSITGMRLVTKGAVQVIDPRLYIQSAKLFKRLARDTTSVDLYWDIMPLMEEQNRRRIARSRSSVINAVVFEDDLIDYGTPERLAITRKRYNLASTKRA